jgi:hypothetical protein
MTNNFNNFTIEKKASYENYNGIPIIMISGAYPKKLVKEFAEKGVRYLLKRNNFKDFKIAVEKILDESIPKLKV